MDQADPHASCPSLAEQRRRAEPFVFFFGTLAVIGLAIIAVVIEGRRQVGPQSAQHPAAAHAH